MTKNNTRIASPRISQITVDFLRDHFGTINAGAEYILNSIPVIFNRFHAFQFLQEFRPIEFDFLYDKCARKLDSPFNAGHNILTIVEEKSIMTEEFDNYGIKPEAFISKIKAMSFPERFCLEILLSARMYK